MISICKVPIVISNLHSSVVEERTGKSANKDMQSENAGNTRQPQTDMRRLAYAEGSTMENVVAERALPRLSLRSLTSIFATIASSLSWRQNA